MLFACDEAVQIARRSAVRPGLAFAGDTERRSCIHARWNPKLDGLFALESPVAAALVAALLHNLPHALARWAGSRDGEESLLVGELTAAGASLASATARALIRAGAVAGLADFLPRQLDLGGHARVGFFEPERHVVAQIGAALRAAASTPPAASSKQVLEAKEISENIMEILEDGVVKSLAGAGAGKARMTVGVVNLALLRVAQHAVGFGTFAEPYLRLGLVFRIAIRVPFQRRFAVRGLDFVDGCRSRHAQNFVVVPLSPLGHEILKSPFLVHCFFRCGTRMHRYTHHGGTQHSSMKHISRLKHLQDGAVLVVC